MAVQSFGEPRSNEQSLGRGAKWLFLLFNAFVGLLYAIVQGLLSTSLEQESWASNPTVLLPLIVILLFVNVGLGGLVSASRPSAAGVIEEAGSLRRTFLKLAQRLAYRQELASIKIEKGNSRANSASSDLFQAVSAAHRIHDREQEQRARAGLRYASAEANVSRPPAPRVPQKMLEVGSTLLDPAVDAALQSLDQQLKDVLDRRHSSGSSHDEDATPSIDSEQGQDSATDDGYDHDSYDYADAAGELYIPVVSTFTSLARDWRDITSGVLSYGDATNRALTAAAGNAVGAKIGGAIAFFFGGPPAAAIGAPAGALVGRGLRRAWYKSKREELDTNIETLEKAARNRVKVLHEETIARVARMNGRYRTAVEELLDDVPSASTEVGVIDAFARLRVSTPRLVEEVSEIRRLLGRKGKRFCSRRWIRELSAQTREIDWSANSNTRLASVIKALQANQVVVAEVSMVADDDWDRVSSSLIEAVTTYNRRLSEWESNTWDAMNDAGTQFLDEARDAVKRYEVASREELESVRLAREEYMRERRKYE